MLGDPSHLDKAHLQTLADLEWRQAAGPTTGTAAALSKHFSALLDQGDSLRPLAIDATLVSQARATVRQTSIPAILYYGIKREYTDESKPGVRLDQLVGLDAEKVFTRRSGTPIASPIARLYTRDGFKEITSDRTELVKYLTNDAWVLGDNTVNALTSAGSLASGMTNMYELDYIREWDALLDDLQFARFQTVAQTTDALRILTAPASPLRGLLRVVGEQTTLVEPQTATPQKGVIAETRRSITDRFNQVVKPLQEATGMASVQPGTLVTAHFSWVRQMTAGEAGQTPIDNVIKSIAAIQQQLSTLGPDVAGTDPVQILSSPTFRALTQNLREQAAVLPPGLRTLVGQIGQGVEGSVTAGATSQIEQMYRQDVLPACQRVISGRYPFGPATQPDVQLADFGEMFGFGGVFDKFFTDNLANMVDASDTTWHWREGAVTASQRMLDQNPGRVAHSRAVLRAWHQDAEARFLRDDERSRIAMRPASFSSSMGSASTIGTDRRRVVRSRGRGRSTAAASSPHSRRGSTTIRNGSAAHGPGSASSTPRRKARPMRSRRSGFASPTSTHSIRLTVESARGGANPFAYTGWRQFSCQVLTPMDVGFYGKLPSHGDFLRRRVSDEFVDAWDAWLRECLSVARNELGSGWLDVYLTSPAWRFVCGAGACGPMPVIGLLAPSVDRVGRYFPLTIVAELPDDVGLLTAASTASAFLDAAELLVIEMLATDDVDFEAFDSRVAALEGALSIVRTPAGLPLAPDVASVLTDPPQAWQIPISASAQLGSVFEQLVSRQLEIQYAPLVMLWTDGSALIEPSCLLLRGLPTPERYTALLKGDWSGHQWRTVPTAPSSDPILFDTYVPEPSPVDEFRSLAFRLAAASDMGRARSNNEDNFVERPDVGVWVVADGMGGHERGEVASGMVCDALMDFHPDGSFDGAIAAATQRIRDVNDHLLRMAKAPDLSDASGSTVVTLMLRGSRSAVLWAGDSRVYRLRDGRLEQLSRDHSLAELEGPGAAESSIITRAVGMQPDLTLDVRHDEVRPGDRFLLCSDGLTRVVPDDRIEELVSEADIETAVDRLIEATLDAGAPDNVTVVVVEALG
ncbi:MAG: type VI secretion system-associated protein TagF [Vicinamibacterales bacterium]